MAKLLGKLKDGRDLYGTELQNVEVKALGDNEIEMVGTTDSVDRDNEVLSMDGWDLKAYKKNPVVLEAHNYWEPPVARTTKLRVEGNKMIFKIEFPPEGIYPRADLFKKLYKLGFMKASSVGFIPSEYKLGNGVDEPRRTFLKQELTEISLVTVPANPEALLAEKSIIDAKEKGVLTDTDMETLKALIASVAKGVVTEKQVPADAMFKAFVSPEGDFASGTKDDALENSEKKVVQKKKSGDTEGEGTIKSLGELLKEAPEVFSKAVQAEVVKMLKGGQVSEEVKDALVQTLSEIREDEKYKMLLFGASAETQPQKTALDDESITAEGIAEIAKSVK